MSLKQATAFFLMQILIGASVYGALAIVSPKPACLVPKDRESDVFKGIRRPVRLNLLSRCELAKGRVIFAAYAADGDYVFDIDVPQQYAHLLSKNQSFLHIEIIPLDQGSIYLPKVGDFLGVEGVWTFDINHHWDEIHPAWEVIKVPQE